LPVAAVLPDYQLAVPPPAPEDVENSSDRVAFDWYRADVRCIDGHWKLTAGERCLIDFEARSEMAFDALRIVQYYRFTEQCRLGSGPLACTYYLVNGEAPRGVMLGLECVEFRPEQLALRQVGEAWAVCSHGRPLVIAGNSVEEANEALQMIQRYQFTHVCYLGNPERPAMSILVRDH
jgi:hypothetical protein